MAEQPPVAEPMVMGDTRQTAVAWVQFFQAMADQLGTLAGSTSYADDTAAAAGGVPIGGLYRNGSAVMVRVA